VGISAAMIVRNEARGIEAALRSLIPVVDEIVLVDTGSTDDTVAIAQRLVAQRPCRLIRILHEPWANDFARARNFAQDATSGACEWIVVLDGDEVLEPGDLRGVMLDASPEVNGVVTQVVAARGDGSSSRELALRAYRKDVGRWKYPVHNQLVGVTRHVRSTAVVRTSYQDVLERKVARSIPMLDACYRSDPADGHAPFFLAKTYCALQDWQSTIRWCETCRAVCPDAPQYASFWIWYAQAVLLTQGESAAREILAEGLARHPGLADLWHMRIALDSLHWLRTAREPGNYLFASQLSTLFAKNVDAVTRAWRALGLPIGDEATNQPTERA
jgi:glycosyl transferase family 2